MSAKRLNRRTRLFLLWTARLAFLAYVLQVAAIDHWRPDPTPIAGVAGSSEHVLHCHGSASGCADGVTNFPTAAAETVVIPIPPAVSRHEAALTSATPLDAFVATPHQPPRTS